MRPINQSLGSLSLYQISHSFSVWSALIFRLLLERSCRLPKFDLLVEGSENKSMRLRENKKSFDMRDERWEMSGKPPTICTLAQTEYWIANNIKYCYRLIPPNIQYTFRSHSAIIKSSNMCCVRRDTIFVSIILYSTMWFRLCPISFS